MIISVFVSNARPLRRLTSQMLHLKLMSSSAPAHISPTSADILLPSRRTGTNSAKQNVRIVWFTSRNQAQTRHCSTFIYVWPSDTWNYFLQEAERASAKASLLTPREEDCLGLRELKHPNSFNQSTKLQKLKDPLVFLHFDGP